MRLESVAIDLYLIFEPIFARFERSPLKVAMPL